MRIHHHILLSICELMDILVIFFVFAVMHNATNTRVPGFEWPYVFILLDISLGMELLDHMLTLSWNSPL